MYCIFSKEALKKMQGVRGKMSSQAGHAFLHAYWDSEERFPEHAKTYKASDHAIKITCAVETDSELEELVQYKDVCGFTKVIDSGFTVFEEPTLTCIGIGPLPDDSVEKLKALKLLM